MNTFRGLLGRCFIIIYIVVASCENGEHGQRHGEEIEREGLFAAHLGF